MKKEWIDLALWCFVAALAVYLLVDLSVDSYKNKKKS